MTAVAIKGDEATPTRPLLRWHGGKWRIAPWIIQHFPAHRCYVEPFGGAASVLLRKPRSYAEIYNDLDGTLVDLFRVLRDDAAAARLVRQLELTPFAREEFAAAYEMADDLVERARRTVVRSFMGFGSDATAGIYRTGFRANSNRSGTTPAHDWKSYPGALRIIVNRLKGIVIESRAALKIMQQHDAPTTLFYLDPPYLHETRCRRNNRRGVGVAVYEHELTTEDHAELLTAVRELRGMVLLSGYPSPLYEAALVGWGRAERRAHADGARPRTEVLWINPAAHAGMPSPSLFRSNEQEA